MALCGAGSFPSDDEDIAEASAAAAPSETKKTKQQTLYSTRGLDKFSAVLADLGARKERIMAKAGSRGVAMVRFVYDSSKDWVPVIVRQKPPSAPAPPPLLPPSTESTEKPPEELERKAKKQRSSGSSYCCLDWKDSYYWPVVVVLILVCLVVFGKVFAICCTCVWWYMTPTLKEWSGKSVKKLMDKKKAFVRSKRLNYGTGNVD